MIDSDGISLLFRAKGDTDDAKKAFQSLSSSFDESGKSASTLGNVLPIVGTVIAAVGAAAVTAAGYLFQLSERSAEFGSKIFDLTQKTGLAAETISSLKFAADQSGSSIEQMSDAVSKFSKLIGEAVEGSKTAKETLIRLGLDPKTAINDLDASLAKVFKSIADAENPIVATKIATDAFGKSGADLIPVLKSFDGDLAGLIEQCKKLGVTITDEAAAKADAFGDTLDTTKAQIAGVAMQIGFELIPNIQELASVFSDFLTDNKGEMIEWGKAIVDTFRDAIIGARTFAAVLKDIPIGLAGGGQPNTEALWKQLAKEKQDRQLAKEDSWEKRDADNEKRSNRDTQPSFFSDSGDSDKEAEKRRKEREDAFKKELEQRDEQNQILLRQNREDFTAVQEEWEKAFQNGEKSKEEYRTESLSNIDKYEKAVRAFLAKDLELDSTGKSGTELTNIQLKYANAIKALEREVAREREDVQKLVTESEKKENDEKIAQTRDELKQELSLREAANRKINAENEQSAALGIITDEKVAQNRRILDLEYLNFKIENLEKQRALFAANSDEEKQITQEIALLKEDIAVKETENRTAAIIDEKKRREEEKQAAQELLEIKKRILQVEREILDFRAAQTKKSLENTVENSSGVARIEALRALQAFEIAEEYRKEAQRAKDWEADRAAELERITGKENEEAQKAEIENLYRQKALISEQEFQQRLKEIRDGFDLRVNEEGKSPFQTGLEDFIAFLEQSVGMANIAVGALGILKNAFQGVAQAIGSVIQQWVLYGSTGPAIMRKILAQALATIAAEAAVQAIYATALGFLRLAQWDFVGAGHAFVSAGIWAAIAGVAAVSGRLVAGDAFKQQTATATGTSSNSGGGGRSSTSGAYSSYGDETQVVESGRNSPSGIGVFRHEITLKVKEKGGWFGQMLEMDVENNGKSRNVILDLVDA